MTKKGKDTVIVTLSGPMRGYEDWNYPLFHEVACAWLDQHPHDKVLNPAKNFKGKQDLPIEVYMQKSLEQVLACNFLVLLPGWKNSEGAQHEVRVAKATGKIFYRANLNGDGWEFVWASADEITAEPPEPTAIGLWQTIPQGFDPLKNAKAAVRTFESGATRDTEDGKLDYEAFLSPLVLERYAQYMHKHRERSDHTLRAGDDWQKGIPTDVYMKSMWRHFMDVWHRHRIGDYPDTLKAEALCGVLFNAMGYLYQLEKRSEW